MEQNLCRPPILVKKATATVPQDHQHHRARRTLETEEWSVKAVDAGERTYEFQFGKHKGQFKLINAAPKHLRPFIGATQELISSIEEAVRAKGKK